jgi:hypothetical protein
MPSVIVALPVLTAVVAKLKADATLSAIGIYNVVPQGALRPYLVIDGATEVPFNTLGTPSMPKWGGDVTFQAKVVSNQSDSEGLTILSRVKTVLDGQPLTMAGFPTVIVSFDSLQPSFTEIVAGSPVRHVPSVFRVQAHES